MDRDISKVIEDIKSVMPSDNPWQTELDKLAVSVSYSAPEQKVQRWTELAEIVNGSLVDTDWKRKMVNTLLGLDAQAAPQD